MHAIRSDAAFLSGLLLQRRPPEGEAQPLMPWLAPPAPPAVLALMRRVGRRRELRAGEFVFGPRDAFDSLVLLESGLGARAFGGLYNQRAAALALTSPGRIIGGNHCFFSGMPGIGRYFALTPATALYAEREALLAELRRDAALFEAFAAFLDRLIQSDRIGFGAIALLCAKDRLLMWALSWGLVYGDLMQTPEGERLVMSPVLSANLLSHVVSANLSQTKRDIAALKRSGAFSRMGDALSVDAAMLDPVWDWLRNSEELTAKRKRPADWRPYCLAARRPFSPLPSA